MNKHTMSLHAILYLCGFAALSPAFGGEKPKLPVDLPLPDDVTIVPPDAAVRPALMNLSGVWCGNWENTLDVCLLVEKISPEGATILYTWGDASKWNVSRGHQRYAAAVESDKLLFPTQPGKQKFVASLFDARTMEFVRTRSDVTKTTTLKKVN